MSEYRKLISIIVPIFNSEAYLDNCIYSILQQDYRFFELLLVDDGSTDLSGTLADAWAEKDNRIQVFHKNNGGQSSARNEGLRQAKGEYITFVDSDDYVLSDYLTYLISLFTPTCQFTTCNHYVIRGNKQKKNSSSVSRLMTKKEAFEEVLFHGCIDVAPWGKLYKREIFEKIRFPEGRIFEDTWLFGDILKQSENVAFGEKCCYNYVIHNQSTVRKAYSSQNLQYVESAKKLATDALCCDPGLKTGAIRRINHARISVLRYMEHSQEIETKKGLRKEILQEAPQYITDPRTPRRDRVAVFLLKMGFVPFYYGWRIYSLFR